METQRTPRIWIADGIIAVGVTLFAIDAFFNWTFNQSMATTDSSRLAMGIAGVGIAALLALLAIGRHFIDPKEQKGAKRQAHILMGLCALWGVWSAMGQVSTHRSDSVAGRVHEQQTYKANASELPRLQAERDGIKARPAAQVQADIARWKARHPASLEVSGNCAPGTKSGVCNQIQRLMAELGAAQRREALDARIAKMMDANASASGRVESDADPQAAAAQAVASVFGMSIQGDTLAKLAPVLFSLILLLGGWWAIDLGFRIRGVEFKPEAKSAEVIHFARAHSPTTVIAADDTAWAKAVLKAAKAA